MKIDWAAYAPPKPTFTGTRVFRTYDVAELVPLIDWTPFFQTWELKGRFPAILEDEKQGAAARQLYEDAQEMLRQHRRGALVQPEGGDRLLAGQRGRRRHPPLHRREPPRDARDVPRPAPAALEARRAPEPVPRRFRRARRDRARRLYRRLRRDRRHRGGAHRASVRARQRRLSARSWSRRSPTGSPRPSPSACTSACAGSSGATRRTRTSPTSELIGEEYRGIRPAPGYPAQPDHTEKATLFRLTRGRAPHRRQRSPKATPCGRARRCRVSTSPIPTHTISASPRSSATRSRITPPARA